MVPTTVEEKAWTDFAVSRMVALQQSPLNIDPSIFLPIFQSNSSSNSTPPTSSLPSSASGTMPTGALAGALAEAETSQASTSDSTVVSLLDKYGPVVVGLLAGNIIVMGVLCITALVACTRGAMRGAARTREPTSYAPVSVKDKSISEDAQFSALAYKYED